MCTPLRVRAHPDPNPDDQVTCVTLALSTRPPVRLDRGDEQAQRADEQETCVTLALSFVRLLRGDNQVTWSDNTCVTLPLSTRPPVRLGALQLMTLHVTWLSPL